MRLTKLLNIKRIPKAQHLKKEFLKLNIKKRQLN